MTNLARSCNKTPTGSLWLIKFHFFDSNSFTVKFLDLRQLSLVHYVFQFFVNRFWSLKLPGLARLNWLSNISQDFIPSATCQ